MLTSPSPHPHVAAVADSLATLTCASPLGKSLLAQLGPEMPLRHQLLSVDYTADPKQMQATLALQMGLAFANHRDALLSGLLQREATQATLQSPEGIVGSILNKGHRHLARLTTGSSGFSELTPEEISYGFELGLQIRTQQLPIPLPATFCRSALDRLNTLSSSVVASLQPTLEGKWWKNHVQPLAASIHALCEQLDPRRAEVMLDLLSQQRDNRELRLSEGRESDLYILAFLPQNVRFALQPLLLYHEAERTLEQSMSSAAPELAEVHRLLITRSRASVLADEHLNFIYEVPGLAESALDSRFRESSAGSAARFELHELLATHPDRQAKFNALGAALCARVEQIQNAIRSRFAPGSTIPYFLLNTDPGHFIAELPFYYAVHRLSSPIRIKPAAREGAALIVEDNADQRQLYEELVAKASPFSLLDDGASVCSTPAEARARLTPELLARIRLFIIDIESPGSPTAGISFAEEILRQLAERWDSQPPKNTRVHIWSANPERLVEAREALTSVAQQINLAHTKFNNGAQVLMDGSFTSDAHIALSIAPKGKTDFIERFSHLM